MRRFPTSNLSQSTKHLYQCRKQRGEEVGEISTRDGVKYILKDNSWLLIRPSGTEPVLRVYAECRTAEMVTALLAYGEKVATDATQ